jgi:hypothetical protein
VRFGPVQILRPKKRITERLTAAIKNKFKV